MLDVKKGKDVLTWALYKILVLKNVFEVFFHEFKHLTLEITLYSGFPNDLIGCFIITNNTPVFNTGALDNTQPLNNW